MDLKLFVEKNLIYSECPNCHSHTSLERVKNNSEFEKLIYTFLRIKKYHCNKCKWYGKRFIFTLSRNYVRVLFNYLILTIFFILVVLFFNSYFERTLKP